MNRIAQKLSWQTKAPQDMEAKSTAATIREGLLKGNLEAGYFLFINRKAIGVLEELLADIKEY